LLYAGLLCGALALAVAFFNDGAAKAFADDGAAKAFADDGAAS